MMQANGDSRENGHGPMIMALEIEQYEDEQESLIQETMEMDDGVRTSGLVRDKIFLGRNAHGMRHRGSQEDPNGGGTSTFDRGAAYIQGFLRSDLVTHAAYYLRNFFVLGLLALFVLIVIELEGGFMRSEQMAEVEPSPPHTQQYGGSNNRMHNPDDVPLTPKKPLDGTHLSPLEQQEALHQQILDEEADFSGPWDLSIQNDLNENAHYMHDPHQSPFASVFYADSQDEKDKRQAIFTDKRNAIVAEFGVWNNPNFEGAINNPEDMYLFFDYRDVPLDDFPPNVWQKDRDYIQNFINEASALVEAVKEGIMQEYNHPNANDDEKNLFGVIIGDYNIENGAAVDPETGEKRPGIAYLPQSGWDGLVKKLLHAMITTDYFYVVCVGKDDTYKANNFWQSQVMQFNHVMEPVFHKLGMTLISRNMGLAASTAFSALGGADIYGETDILWHFQAHDQEEKSGEYDLLQKQSILAGERVPVILSPVVDELAQASKQQAWVGNLQPGADVCEQTTMQILPEAPACHNVNCALSAQSEGKCNVYNSACWVPREDYNPPEESQNKDAGDQNKDFPGYRTHQLEGRKMTLLVLHALGAALNLWKKKLEDGRSPLPLPVEDWHVGESYKRIREAVMSLERTAGESVQVPSCEVLMNGIDPRICHLPMHAYTEWTPRVAPRTRRLLHIIDNFVDGEIQTEKPNVYDGPDIIPIDWQIPADQMDVHMIAIAANRTEKYDEDIFGEEWADDEMYYDGGFGRHLKTTITHERTPKLLSSLRDSQLTVSSGRIATSSNQITAGAGWQLVGAPSGFCDGSSESRCNRQETNPCLLANHNHYKANVVGKPVNGWLVMTIPHLRHGLILARLEFVPGPAKDLPSDLVFDYAINGDIKSVESSGLATFGEEVVNGMTVYPLLIDQGYASHDIFPDGRNCEVAIRIRSSADSDCEIRFSHIYFA